MEISFFASPTDIKNLFTEIEAKTPLHYFWGFGGPLADVIGPFNSCDEIDCFGYALDHIYRLDFNVAKEPFQIAQNMRGYYNQSCALSLTLYGRTGTAYMETAFLSAAISCPINAPQNSECRKLFLRIKRKMTKSWHKINGMFFGDEVYEKRMNLIFLNREGYVNNPFYFDDGDNICETPSDRLSDKGGRCFIEAPFTLKVTDSINGFYSSERDIIELFRAIEEQFSLRYKYRKEKSEYSKEFFTSFAVLREDVKKQNLVCAYELQYRNSVEIQMGSHCGNVVVPWSIGFERSCPRYGGTLFRFIIELITKSFKPVHIKHYGTYYLSPEIWESKEHLIFDNGDPRFRWENGEFVNVWRAEWEAMK